MPSRFVPNRNFKTQLVAEPAYRKALEHTAGVVVDNAKSVAPELTGDYKRGLEVVTQGERVYASGTDWKSGFIEFGTVKQPAFSPLRRGVRAAGLKLTES